MVATPILAQLAPPTSADDWNSALVSWLAVIAIAVVHVWSKIVAMRRKPSVDVDLVKLNAELRSVLTLATETKTRLESLPSHVGELATINANLEDIERWQQSINARLTTGDETMASLRANQAVNAESIRTIRADMHDVFTLVTAIAAKLNVKR